ncbi:hypothetical protein ASG81_01715 [Paenibacillus sp. Soil522]|nr:hypothetical protein ASG81_01715 [Paenibacillus sp. Soil522]
MWCRSKKSQAIVTNGLALSFSEIKAMKAKIHNLVRLWICMVEARGFEPLSEDHATQASTGVVTVLMSPEYRPVTHHCLNYTDYLGILLVP